MKMKEKQVTLKNGTQIILKSVGEDEAEAVLDFMKTVYSDTDNLSMTVEEVEAIPVNAERDIIKNYEKQRSSLMISAYLNGQIVANCSVHKYSEKSKYSHRAEAGVAVKKEYWNLGIGSALLSTLIDFAGKAGYEQLELETANDNVNAIILYTKFGFQAVGCIPRAQKVDGQFRDFIKLVKYLDKQPK